MRNVAAAVVIQAVGPHAVAPAILAVLPAEANSAGTDATPAATVVTPTGTPATVIQTTAAGIAGSRASRVAEPIKGARITVPNIAVAAIESILPSDIAVAITGEDSRLVCPLVGIVIRPITCLPTKHTANRFASPRLFNRSLVTGRRFWLTNQSKYR